MIPFMVERGGGAVVITDSIAGIRPAPNIGAYNVSKAGVIALTKTLAMECAPPGIRVNALDAGRIGVAAQALGIAKAAYEASVKYACEREAFGQVIGQFQMIQKKLADIKTRIEAACFLIYNAALAKERFKETGERYTLEAAMAKLFASETAMWATTQAVQIHGGMGYSKELPIERYFHDAKITEIYEGTSEIQRIVIARAETGLRRCRLDEGKK
jgi:alkylation response protein AidB-like acyl-CoA dehydrogenase